jgi:WD40 repeat protein
MAQAALTNLTQPIPVINTGGHSAPVRALVFAPPDGAQLLSAGFDKIIQVWNLRDAPPGLAKTIRPRIWRGYAGVIYAMVLAPQADTNGQRLLAVAGFGLQNSRGEIGLFRYPGSSQAATGDVAGELPGGPSQGHTGSVMSLAFDPRGRFLASASMDGTVRLWDLTTRSSVALVGHTGPVNVVAYSPEGRRLVSGGADGSIVLWDVDRRTRLLSRPPDRRNTSNQNAINTLAVSPDGRWVVVGREGGNLVRYDAANLGNPFDFPRGSGTQGAVEALAISHDGKSLVSSIVSFGATSLTQRPRVECDIELRNMPDGVVRARPARTSNLVYACAFSPDDRRVAFAGGDTQGITITDVLDPNRPSLELAGKGSSLWDVGFSANSRSIGVARNRPDLPDPPSAYEDFDLDRERVTPFAPAELSRGLATWNGWTVRPVGPYTLDVLNAANRGHRLNLDPTLDRRWWCMSFLPPGPGHPRPTIGVGCESGVAVYRLDDGTRTRLLAGHNGPVYALAPSPDGRWLVTGSSDQTARLWRLVGCDTLAPLGARFTPAGSGRARASVASVDRFGFAESSGMKAGDEIVKCYVGGKLQTSLAELDTVPPNVLIEFLAQRQGVQVMYNTTKRDAPALTIFPALDREWIVWTPEGYYETSAIGDRRYLGWHRNRLAAGQPTDYFTFDHFEKELRRGDALRRFLTTGDRAALAAEVTAPPPVAGAVAVRTADVVAEDLLPQVAILAPEPPAFAPLVVAAGVLPLRVRAATEDAGAGRGLIGRIRVQLDGAGAAEAVVDPPLAEANRELSVRLGAGRHRVSVTAWNNRAQYRTKDFDVIAQEPPQPQPQPPPQPAGPPPQPPPQPAGPPPQLIVLAIGAGAFSGDASSVPPIPFADQDTRDLAAFLAAPLGSPRYPRVETRSLIGPQATADRINQALEQLDQQRTKGELLPGDAVFMTIELHFVSFEPPGTLLGSDATGQPPSPAVSAAAIADCLGQLADYGCKVVLVVDPLHERRPQPRQTDRTLIEWARSLYLKNVITFVASIHGPSQRLIARGHGAFAEGILGALNVRSQARLATSGSSANASEITLFEFQDVVARNVLALTNRQQHARCYIPDTIPSMAPIFDPPSRGLPAPLPAAGE